MKKLLLLSFLLSGCSGTTINEIRDDDLMAGCYVVGGQYNGTYINGGMQVCKLKCSENLPEGFKYSYQSNGCNISIGD